MTISRFHPTWRVIVSMFMLVFALAACGDSSDSGSDATAAPSATIADETTATTMTATEPSTATADPATPSAVPASTVESMASPAAPSTPIAESGDYPDTTVAATEATTDTGRVEVTIEGFAFAPAMLEIPAGTTVVFTNRDSAPHTVTDSADAGLFDSDNMAMGDSFEFTFDTPGTYEYFCRIHPTMVATIVVS